MTDDINVTLTDEEIIDVTLGDTVIVNNNDLPPGGNTDDVLTKLSPTDFDAGWRPISSLFQVDWGDIGGTLSAQTDLQAALNLKYDASNPDGFISGVSWGDITGTLSDQTDLQNSLNLKEDTANKNQANGYAGLDGDGKIISTLLPSLVITETFVVASQAAMLALTAQQGDVAVRTDLNKSFILTNNDPATLSSWQELLTPTDSVLSWNGRTGAIVPVSGDYTASQITNVPAGGIAANTVQAALNELDTEKANASSLASYVLKAGDAMTGTLSTSGAFVASGDFAAAPTAAGTYIGTPTGLNPRITFANGNTGATGAVSIDNGNGTIRFLHSSQGTILGTFSESALFPGTNLNKKLGDTGAYWSELYAQRHYVNSTAYIDGASAGVLAFTGNITTGGTLTLSRSSIAASIVINVNQDRPLEINGSDAARVRPFVNNNNAAGDAQFSYASLASTKWSAGFQAATGNFVIADSFQLSASERLTIQTSGRVGIGVTVPTGFLDIRASTTGTAHMRLRTGVAPTTPNDGDIWFDGTALRIRIGGVTRSVNVT